MPDFTASDGTRLFFRDEGDGIPILCLSGLTRNSTDFEYVLPELSGHRVIRLDYRGRGKSDWADPVSYTIMREGQDALELLDHLEIEKAAIIGTSRGGIIAMGLSGTVKERLLGVCLNDIGPEIAAPGLEAIKDYLGRKPTFRTLDEATYQRARLMVGFANIPEARWRAEAEKHYVVTSDGLDINYDPKLRDGVLAQAENLTPDLWPFFDAMTGLPLALIRGANSDLLTEETAQEMRRRRPDMLFADVPDRGHVPFLDEPDAVEVIRAWLEKLP